MRLAKECGIKSPKFSYRVTPWILGTSPGSRIAYDTPENVVPTSKAMTKDRVLPPAEMIRSRVRLGRASELTVGFSDVGHWLHSR